ncbi:MAG: RNA polymerase sigma factor [Firmicutes bacterium]|nr:RNA polymerase sigma factor [Bacillota bacterium]
MIAGPMTATTAAQDLFERFGAEVYDHVYLMAGSRPDAEDIVQDIFLRVLQSWTRFRHGASERTWLWSITRNCLREYYRRERFQRHHRAVLTEDMAITDPAAPLCAVELHAALQSLTMSQRQVFICRAIQGLSGKETAQLLGWSDVKVRVTLHRATQRLQEVLTHDQGN